MENNSEDFFDLFKDKVVSKTKKFNFKKTDRNGKKDVKSPFFANNSTKIGRNEADGNLGDNNSIKDNVEKQLNELFNGTSEDDVFMTEKVNQTPQKALHLKKETIKDNLTSKVENPNKLNEKHSLAPIFLINKKQSDIPRLKSTQLSNDAKSSKEKIVGNNTKLLSEKSTSKFKFKKKSVTEDAFKTKDTHHTKAENVPCVSSFNRLSVSKNLVRDDDFLPTREYENSNANKSAKNEQAAEKKLLHSEDTDQVSSLKRLNTHPSNQENSDGSPIIRPKKFAFKKKISTSSTSSLSQLFTKKSPEKDTIRGSKTPPKKLQDSPLVISSNESFHKSKTNVHCDEVIEVKKNLFSNTPLLDDTVHFVSQSLQATEADYMTEEQFQKFLSSTNDVSNDFQKTATTELPLEDFDLSEVDWNEQFEQEKPKSNDNNSVDEVDDIDWSENVFSEEPAAPTGFLGEREDDSAEFRKSYHFSEVMMEVLHDKFGLREFRPHQREVINASLNRHDCFVLMPTGGGKSLCYQLPAILSEGVTIVISPLRALISDQVDKLNALDIAAAHLCANVSEDETKQILSKLNMREPGIKLLYLTPEKIVASQKIKDTLDSLYQRDKLARFVIDEAHCLSQWGHDFRPDYKQLSILRRQFQKVPIICLTATATKQVETDVINILKLKNIKRFIRSFNRPNIKYQVLPKTNKIAVKEISNLIRSNFPKKSGIIYCLARNDCQQLAENLNSLGIKTKPYHAGMSDKVRENIQREWMQDRFYVIVATIAFGMGIDKPDVRFVIHNSIPKSVEAFYQESGRAGRDGEISYSYLYYSYGDVGRLQKVMQMDKNCNRKALEGHLENLKQMVAFAENVVDCRRHLQLLHLGENFDRRLCMKNKETTCDNCENFQSYNLVDITKEAKELATLVEDLSLKGHVTLFHVTDVYRGSKLKKILDRKHDCHKYYGVGSKMERLQITRILKDLILKGVLADHHMYTGEFPVVYIKPGPKFHTLRSANVKFTLPISTNNKIRNSPQIQGPGEPGPSNLPVVVKKPVSKPAVSKFALTQLKVQCHEELLEECRRLALEKNVTLSSIMNLSAIKSMSEVLPKNKDEFLKIQHVTAANFNKFGDFFLRITTKFREQLESMQAVVENSPPKSYKSSSFEDDDFCPTPSQKRKYNGGYKKGAKRFKRSNYRGKPKKTFKTAKKGTPKKATTSKKWLGKTKGGLSLMPVHVK